jgi:hypothetical protein
MNLNEERGCQKYQGTVISTNIWEDGFRLEALIPHPMMGDQTYSSRKE